MSTSPSWFDQDKFSRLVKKVGAKPAAGGASGAKDPKRPSAKDAPARPAVNRIPSTALTPSVKASQPIGHKSGPLPSSAAASAPAPEPPVETGLIGETTIHPGETTLPGFPVSIPPPEPRPVSPLSRRTTPLPNLKSLFEYEKSPQAPVPEEKEIPAFGAKQIDFKEQLPEPDIDDRDMPIEPPTPLPEEDPSSAEPEARPGELELLRSQLSKHDDLVKERDDLAARVDELSGAAQERPLSGETSPAEPVSAQELARAIEDRDTARRDYALLREQFETMKHEQLRHRGEPRNDSEFQREVESLRAQLADRDEELNALKLDPIGVDPEIDSLREEADVLQKQFNQAREEASIAQRGLALSQKALQETRDALREATEGSSQMKSSLESLKNECATLVQQNMLLQAQHDQLSREISTLKTKSLPRPPVNS